MVIKTLGILRQSFVVEKKLMVVVHTVNFEYS